MLKDAIPSFPSISDYGVLPAGQRSGGSGFPTRRPASPAVVGGDRTWRPFGLILPWNRDFDFAHDACLS